MVGIAKPSSLRIGKRYRANRLNGPYDAIVIGSGIGGLTTAACLSKSGKKVLVLEKHYTAGGFTHAYERNGYEWDVGVHYVGDIGHSGTMANRLNNYITEGRLEWAPMDEIYDTFVIGDEEFPLKAGKEQFKESILSKFPNEDDTLDKYLKLINECARLTKRFAIGKITPEPLQSILARKLKRHPLMVKTTYEVLSELTDNKKLIAVLTGQWGDLGLPPKDSSFLMHGLIVKHYMHGGYYPVGGSSSIAKTIIPTIQSGGGDVLTYAHVKKIVVNNDIAIGVQMEDGEIIKAPKIISNVGVFNTFNELLPVETSKAKKYPELLSSVRPSMSHLCLYIGLKGTASELKLPKTNFWLYPDEFPEENIEKFNKNSEAEFPVVYISFPSAKDPSWSQNKGDIATIEMVVPASFDWFKKWENEGWNKRGDEYEAVKNKFSTRMIEILLKRMPHLAPFIDYYELSTPITTQYFCNYKQGEIYGLDHEPLRFSQQWLKPKTKIKGLYLTGQDVFSCGIVGAMMAGAICAVSVEGLRGIRLFKKLLEKSPNKTQAQPMAEAS